MADALIGKQLNNFRIERLLGRGGMAQVYLGTDVGLDRPVAIKVIEERWREDEVFTTRFITEARTIATWRHENIIQVYYAGTEEDLYYFVMEYIDGEDLTEFMNSRFQQGNLIPVDRVVTILQSIASGLDYAHNKGVIHRDVKPSNIMMGNDGRVVLMDFGLALDVDKGTIGESFGTPHYIAPEQAVNASTAVAQSDQYALGVIAYEMLTGKVPFDNPSAMNVAIMHINDDPPKPTALNPKLTPEVENVLLKVLSKKPVDRFPSCQAFVQNLEDAIAGRPTLLDNVTTTHMGKILITPPAKSQTETLIANGKPPIKPGESSGNKSRLPLTIGAVALVAVVIIGLLGALGGNNSPQVEMTATIESQIIITETDNPTQEPTATQTETSVPSTATDVPTSTNNPSTATDVPTSTDSPPTATIPATATDSPPTATNVPEDTSVPVVAPTLAYPDGVPVVLYYNSSSFYVWNPTANRIRAGDFAFEALDSDGNTLARSFDGVRWTQFYSFIDGGGCVAIEMTTGSLLNPAECAEENALVNTTPSGDVVFWQGARVTGFRVLWQEEEVARCETSAGECAFNIR